MEIRDFFLIANSLIFFLMLTCGAFQVSRHNWATAILCLGMSLWGLLNYHASVITFPLWKGIEQSTNMEVER